MCASWLIGKGKATAAEADVSEPQQHEAGSELMAPAVTGQHEHQQVPIRQRRQQQQQLLQQQQRHSLSHSSSLTAEWPSQGVLPEQEDSATSKAGDSRHARKQPKQSASTSPGASGKGEIIVADVLHDTDPAAGEGHAGTQSTHEATGCACVALKQ